MAEQQRKLRLSPKEEALQNLENARSILGEHIYRAADELNPRTMVARSIQEHRWAWIGAASFGGLVLVRMLFPRRRKFERDNAAASATKSGLIALILAPMLGMVRRAALNHATQYAKTYLREYLSRREGKGPHA